MLIQFNQYPENYEEEKMPQVVIEIRYRKGRKTEALSLAKEIIILTTKDFEKEKTITMGGLLRKALKEETKPTKNQNPTLRDLIRANLIYTKNGKKYRKIGKNEKIAEGAMTAWNSGELQPIRGTTVDRLPAHFAKNRKFYNPI